MSSVALLFHHILIVQTTSSSISCWNAVFHVLSQSSKPVSRRSRMVSIAWNVVMLPFLKWLLLILQYKYTKFTDMIKALFYILSVCFTFRNKFGLFNTPHQITHSTFANRCHRMGLYPSLPFYDPTIHEL